VMRKEAVLAIVLACGLLSAVFPAGADVEGMAKPTVRIPRTALAEEARGGAPLSRIAGGRAAIMIEMEDEPSVRTYVRQRQMNAGKGLSMAQAQAAEASKRQAARIREKQWTLAQALQTSVPSAAEICRVHRAYNGIAVYAPRERIADIEKLPGVKAVHPLRLKTPGLANSVPFVSAPQFWAGLPGSTGAGVTIGIIDTGVDYLHMDFGGQAFPNAKVVGGYDFAGDDYNGQNTPVPDPDPMDAHGHGTHVAGIAAGYGVKSDGTTFSGPYDATVPFGSMRVAPGVAPGAQIYALRVFGRDGSSALIVEAIDWALDPNADEDFSDHLDVINMSLGSLFGDPSDPDLAASNNAASLGMIVVASAGNSGDTYYVTGSPGGAQRAISVASCLDDSSAATADKMSSFSSRGPALGGSMLKPDISAPGQSIVSASYGTGTGSTAKNGTSMAAPHVAGAMALLLDIHPDWTVEELKALLMNTASHDLFAGDNRTPPQYCATRAGSGRMDLEKAGAASSIAYCGDDIGAVGISFGDFEVLTQTVAEKTVKVANKTGAQIQYGLAYSSVSDAPGVDVSFPGGASITVAAQSEGAFSVRLTATASSMSHVRPPALTVTQNGIPRHWLTEECGLVTVTPAGGEALRVPLQASARPSGAIAASNGDIPIAGTAGRFVLNLQGTGLNTGANYPIDEIGLISPCELHAISPNDPETSGADDMGDLKYVGARTDAEESGADNTDVVFAVATHGDWETPNSPIEFDIYIDSDRDGTDDYLLFNWNDGEFGGGKPSDVYISAVMDLETEFTLWGDYINGFPADSPGGGGSTAYDTYPMNSNVMAIPIPARMIGLSDGASRFNYRVETYNLLTGETLDTTPTLTYDAAAPGLDFEFFAYFALDGNTITVDFDHAQLDANNCLGVLLLHHHNVEGNRAQAIPMQYASSRHWEQYR
jgi:subtilisin family serine protease